MRARHYYAQLWDCAAAIRGQPLLRSALGLCGVYSRAGTITLSSGIVWCPFKGSHYYSQLRDCATPIQGRLLLHSDRIVRRRAYSRAATKMGCDVYSMKYSIHTFIHNTYTYIYIWIYYIHITRKCYSFWREVSSTQGIVLHYFIELVTFVCGVVVIVLTTELVTFVCGVVVTVLTTELVTFVCGVVVIVLTTELVTFVCRVVVIVSTFTELVTFVHGVIVIVITTELVICTLYMPTQNQIDVIQNIYLISSNRPRILFILALLLVHRLIEGAV